MKIICLLVFGFFNFTGCFSQNADPILSNCMKKDTNEMNVNSNEKRELKPKANSESIDKSPKSKKVRTQDKPVLSDGSRLKD